RASGTVFVWRLSGGSVTSTVKIPGYQFSSIAFFPDGKTIATGTIDRNVILWDLSNGAMLTPPLKSDDPWVGNMDISSDGSILAAASDDSPIAILWNTSDRKHPKLLGKIHNPRRFSSLAISPDGKTLATGTNNGNLELWDIPTRQRIGESLPQHTGVVNKVVFSVDGKRLAS